MRTKRKTSIEERYYGIKKRQMSFISMVQKRAVELCTSWAPYFPNDLMFKIFLLLPIKSLLRFTCVCKAWYKLIHCAEFVEAYNSQAETTPILLRNHNQERANTFHVETQLKLSENFCLFPCSSSTSKKFIHFLEIGDEKGKIMDPNISCSGSVVAACSGLILITSMYEPYWKKRRAFSDAPLIDCLEKPGRLIIMNPMTRKFIGFPLGTLPYGQTSHDYGRRINESYGLVFSHSEGVYKVVHLFKDKSTHIACEILSLGTRSWKAVDGPNGGVIRKFSHVPITAIGALHWLPDSSGTDYIVSMDADNERFSMTDLPKTLGIYDRLLEMGGFLSLMTSLDKDNLEMWILKGLEGAEWVKQYTIQIDAILGYVDNEEFTVPAFALNGKEMVFRRREGLYSYDFELEEVREIKIEDGKITAHESIMPHSNNLATWEPLEPMSANS